MQVRETVKQSLKEARQFLFYRLPVFEKIHQAFFTSYEIQNVFRQSVFYNVVYVGSSIAYHRIIKPLLIEDRPYQDVAESCAQITFVGMFGCMFVINTAYNFCVIKVAAPLVTPASEYKNGCDCDSIKKTQESLANSFHYVGNILFGNLCYQIPKFAYQQSQWIGKEWQYPSYAIKALAYGYCLLGFKYSVFGVCAKHTRHILDNNKITALMFGALFMVLSAISSMAFNSLANTKDNMFIDDAIFSFMFQVFILISLLQNNILKASDTAYEFFYYPRYFIDKGLKKGADILFTNLDKKQPNNFTNAVNATLASPYTVALANTKPMSLFLDLHQSSLKSLINEIIQCRGYPLWVVDYLPKFITTKSRRVIINILKQQGWEDTEKLITKIISMACNSRDAEEIYVKLYDTTPRLSAQHFLLNEEKPHPAKEDLNSFLVESYVAKEEVAPVVQVEKSIADCIQLDYFKNVSPRESQLKPVPPLLVASKQPAVTFFKAAKKSFAPIKKTLLKQFK